ncbi:MAG TPA: MIP/aquaporin family protein [Planctomycetota bacterium]
MSLPRRLVSEALGTALLLAAVVGSGIMGQRFFEASGLVLLVNTLATAAMLIVLSLVFAGSHFNPAVSVVLAWRGELSWREVPAYAGAQVVGAIGGTLLAHAMFSRPLASFSRAARTGPGQLLSEFVATFGLLLVVRGTRAPYAVGLYIAAAYWFTASTSFANPAVTIARALTDSFAGIRGVDVPGFILAQLAGALCAVALFGWLKPKEAA